MLAAIRQTESQAPPGQLEDIFQNHHKQVFAAAYRLTGSSQDAEDVLQTVFLRLLRRQGEIDLSPSPSSYLHRAAVNAALDLLRARSRSKSVAFDELPEAPEDAAQPSPDKIQEDREARGHLRQALARLTPKSAEIFALRFFEDLSNREIARAMGMSQTAVGVTIFRARNQVKKEMYALAGG